MKNLIDFKKMVKNEEVMLLSNINDVVIATDELNTVSTFNLLLDAGMCSLDVAANIVTLNLLMNEMDEETLESTKGFYKELNRTVRFNETCPEGHVNTFSLCIMNTNPDDKEGLVLLNPLIWAVDDATNSMKIAFEKDAVYTTEGD